MAYSSYLIPPSFCGYRFVVVACKVASAGAQTGGEKYEQFGGAQLCRMIWLAVCQLVWPLVKCAISLLAAGAPRQSSIILSLAALHLLRIWNLKVVLAVLDGTDVFFLFLTFPLRLFLVIIIIFPIFPRSPFYPSIRISCLIPFPPALSNQKFRNQNKTKREIRRKDNKTKTSIRKRIAAIFLFFL